MDLRQYVIDADKTASDTSTQDALFQERSKELSSWLGGNYARLENAISGLAGEAGEVADFWKKLKFHGKKLEDAHKEKLIDELGDICWYLAQASIALNTPLEEIMQRNITKLKARHGDKFSKEYMDKKL